MYDVGRKLEVAEVGIEEISASAGGVGSAVGNVADAFAIDDATDGSADGARTDLPAFEEEIETSGNSADTDAFSDGVAENADKGDRESGTVDSGMRGR